MPNPAQANPNTLDGAQLRLAIQSYLELAYPSGAIPRQRIPEFTAYAHLDEMLASFERTPNGVGVEHYWLRLGNQFYPHMKLVVELTELGPLLSVDTHDQMAFPTNAEAQGEWVEVQRRNLGLRRAIERAWNALGLPTRRACANQARASQRQAAVSPLDCAPVLIVDDEVDAAQLMAVTLRCAGMKAIIATSAKEALRQARKQKPAMVICDYMMPEISGRELLALFKADPALRDIAFVVASYAPLFVEEFPLAAELVPKPLYGKRLIELVKRHALTRAHALSA